MDPSELQTDGRYNHSVQVQERLNFLRYWYSGRNWLRSTAKFWSFLVSGRSGVQVLRPIKNLLFTDEKSISPLSNNTYCSNCISTVCKQMQSEILQLPFGNSAIQILRDRSWRWTFATSFPGHCAHKASWVPHFSRATLFNGHNSVMVGITISRGSFVFSQSRVKVSASLTNVGSIAIGAFGLVNCSLSVVGFAPVFHVGQ